jgi:hypothetical protein
MERTRKSAATLLSRWRDCHALVRPIGPSHGTLQLVLFQNSAEMETNNLCLYLAPLWFQGLFEWADADLGVRIISAAGSPVEGKTQYDTVFEVLDAEAGFRCLTESLEAKENVRLSPDAHNFAKPS